MTATIEGGDRLHETGCALCGATSAPNEMGSQRANPGARACYVCLPAGGDRDALLKAWDNIDAEITRRKSLIRKRAESSPVDETKAPPCDACGEPSCPGPTSNAVKSYAGQWLCASCWMLTTGETLHMAAIRRSPAPSDETKVADPLFCRSCGVAVPRHETTATKARDCLCGSCAVKPVTDPYAPKLTETTGYALWAAEQDGRHAAMVEAHRKELDRTTAERLKNTRNWPEAWSTAGDES